jgi:hypothetical protein
MAHFYGGAVPMHRQLKAMLLPGLPRGWIQARESGGGALAPPLDSRFGQLGGSGFVEPVPDPVGQGPRVPLRCLLVALPLFFRQS